MSIEGPTMGERKCMCTTDRQCEPCWVKAHLVHPCSTCAHVQCGLDPNAHGPCDDYMKAESEVAKLHEGLAVSNTRVRELEERVKELETNSDSVSGDLALLAAHPGLAPSNRQLLTWSRLLAVKKEEDPKPNSEEEKCH